MRKQPWYLLAVLPFALAGYYAAAIAIIPLIYFIVKNEKTLPDLLAIPGLVILVLCEVIYLKDSMGDTYFRMNTVFKCYLPAWLMLGTAAFVHGRGMAAGLGKSAPDSHPGVCCRCRDRDCLSLFATPFFSPVHRTITAPAPLTGLPILKTPTRPMPKPSCSSDRFPAMNSLSKPREVITPIIPGSPHLPVSLPLSVCRSTSSCGGETRTGGSAPAVTISGRSMNSPEKTIPLMKKYNATLLYVGDSERERYNVTLPEAGLEKIYSSRGTDIYRLSG